MATVLERPRWAPRARAIDLTGIPEVQLLKLVNAHSVRAKTVGTGSRPTVLFSVTDIEDWIENEAPDHGPYAVATD